SCAVGGMTVRPSGSTAFSVSDAVVAKVGTNAIGLRPSGTGVTVTGQFSRVQTIGSSGGFVIDGTGSTGALSVTIVNSTTGNNTNGIFVTSDTGKANTQVLVGDTTMS